MRGVKIRVNAIRPSHLAPQIVVALVLALTFAEGQDAAVKLGTELVSANVTVTDKSGRAVEGLRRGDFKIYEDNVEQTISYFSDEDAPASIGIVFDASGSMSEAKIVRAKEALARFFQTSHEQDEYFLISFGSSPRLLLAGSRDGQTVLDQINAAQPKGETALYDAVYLGAEQVSQGIYTKRALILISDGGDNHSRHDFNQVRRKLLESDVTVYCVGIDGNYASPKARLLANGESVMKKLASISGGSSYWPGNGEKMSEAFERIALELRRQYSIGYSPSNFVADGKWHRLKVTVTTPLSPSKSVVRSREGYYAVKTTEDRRGATGTSR
jgi:Ca-activated chloride channel family protein